MKIAILSTTFHEFSGIDRVVKCQAEELAKQGNQITIFTLHANFIPKNVKLVVLGMPKRQFLQKIYRLMFFLDFIKTMKVIRKLKDFDLIISHQYPMNWLAYLTKNFYKEVKYIYYNHGIAYSKLFSGLEKIHIKVINFLTKITIKNVDLAISVSNFLKEELKKEVGMNSIVIYNKIDTKRFNTKIDSTKIRKKYNLNNDPIILYVGRISPHKGVHLLIEAFKLVKKEIKNAKLIIVGKHTFKNYSKRLKKISNDSVIFAGYVPDDEVPYYYAACDIYSTASLWEGFDIPITEAQACGKPVVAFDIGAHKEIINEKGFLIKKGDIKAFSVACINLLNSTSERSLSMIYSQKPQHTNIPLGSTDYSTT